MGEPKSSNVDANPSSRSPEPQSTASVQLLQSVARLDDLASAIQNFRSHFDDLTNHLNFIDNSIQARLSNLSPNLKTKPKPDPTPTPTPAPATAAGNSASPSPRTKPGASLRHICEVGDWRTLRRYIIDRLGDRKKLGEELSAALRAAPNPALLVLDCLGRFFVQGSRAFDKDLKLVQTRKASVLALESLIMTFGAELEVDKEVQRKAEEAAMLWRKRMVNERRLHPAHEMDACGLLFLIAGYGVPKAFSNDEIVELIRVSKAKREVLRRSRTLLSKVTDILENMMTKGMNFEALELVSAFGFEDRFPPGKILTSFVESLKRERREANDNMTLLQQANEKALATMKSALKFIEHRQLDSFKLPLKEMITKLESENLKIAQKPFELGKRRASEDEDRRMLIQETKHPRLASNLSLMHLPSNGLQDRIAYNYENERNLSNGLIRPNVLDPGAARVVADYPVYESVKYGSHPINGHSVEEHIMRGDRAGSSQRFVADHLDFRAPNRDLSYDRSAIENAGNAAVNVPGGAGRTGPSSVYGVPSTGSSMIHREIEANRTVQAMVANGELNGWSNSRDGTLISRPLGRTIIDQPTIGLFGPSTSLESFVGFPYSPPGGASSLTPTDLYRFVDAVVEIECGRGSNKDRRSPSIPATRHPAYLRL